MIKMNELMYARMIRMLFEGASSISIVAETGLHSVTVQSYLRALHKERAIHVIGWVKNTRGVDTTHIFKIGEGEDKPRTKTPKTEIARRYRFRRKLREKMQREQARQEAAL